MTDDQGTVGRETLAPGQSASLHVAYRSQGLDSWRYQLGDGVAQARDFMLKMQTNFRDIDFADDTLLPTSKQLSPGRLAVDVAVLESGFGFRNWHDDAGEVAA